MKIIKNKWFQIGFVTVLTFVSLGAGSQLAQGKTGLALIAGFLWIGYVIYFIFKKA